MRIALVAPRHNPQYPQPPIGLAIVASLLEKAGHQVRVVDADAEPPEHALVAAADADWVGLSAVTPTIRSALTLARQLKEAHPKLTLVLGGPHATLLPQQTLEKAPDIDILVRGEGEETAVELARALEQRTTLEGIKGVSFRQEGRIVHNPDRPFLAGLDSLPLLPYDKLPLRRYRPHPPYGRALPFAALLTTRGCPYNCTFCSKPVFGRRFRVQSAERVLEDIAELKSRYGVREIAFYDDTFTVDRKRSIALAEGMVQRGLKLHWTCGTRVNLVDRELLRLLKKTGCYAISYGVESGDQGILDNLKKGTTLEQGAEAIAMTREAGIYTIGYFMIGSPGETPETIAKTLRFAKALKVDFAQFAITMPFPGTELHDMYIKDKGSEPPWEGYMYATAARHLAPVFETDLLSRNDLQAWVSRAYREFYLRPSYVWQSLRRCMSWGDLKVNARGLFMFMDTVLPQRQDSH